MVRLKTNGVRWELAEELPLKALLADPGKRVKESRVKLVTVHEFAGKTYYVKRYRHGGVRLRPLKLFFKPSQARQEWKLAQELETRGVPIVRHLALGERWTATGLQESILITEGFAGKTPHDWPRVVAFVRQLHELGVLQRDLHPGNILANDDELRLVDLHGIVLKILTAEEIADNFARLRISAPIPLPPEIERRSIEMGRHFYAKRSRRCFKRNWEFDRQNGWYVRKPYLNDALRTILCDPEAFLRQSKLLKQSRTSVVGAGHGVVVKQYNIRRLSRLLKDLFRPSRAVNAYHKAYHLEIAGIPTARPIAAREKRCCRLLLRSWFVMEELPNVHDLSQWTGDYKLGAQRVRELVARLHERGFSHRDLKLTNIVLDAEARPFLVDLEGVQFVGEVTPERAAADLERLARAAELRPELGL
jgi:serine/threonine protein kinase